MPHNGERLADQRRGYNGKKDTKLSFEEERTAHRSVARRAAITTSDNEKA
jgi:hypothetical protein